MLKTYNVKMYHTENAIVERFDGTVNEKLKIQCEIPQNCL